MNGARGVLTVLESREIQKTKVKKFGISKDEWRIAGNGKAHDPAALFESMNGHNNLFGAQGLTV